jgi:hypothetical protein
VGSGGSVIDPEVVARLATPDDHRRVLAVLTYLRA